MVLCSKTRPIDETERRYLKGQRTALIRQRAGLWRNGVWVYAFVAVLAGLTILAERKNPIINPATDAIIIIALWLGFGTAVGIPAAIQQRRALARRIKEYDRLVTDGICSDLRIRARRMWEFEEQHDEGACYAFELEDGGVAFVVGQEFYPGARFPNADFSLIEFHDADGRMIDMMIEKRGARLTAERVVTAKEKERLNIPEHATFFDGTLEQVYGNLKTA